MLVHGRANDFGWEIMTWQAYLRAIARDYDRVVVAGPANSEALYADFADNYFNYDVPSLTANMWMNEDYDQKAVEVFKEDATVAWGTTGDETWIAPSSAWEPYMEMSKWDQLIAIRPQKYIRFGQSVMGLADRYNIVLHARNRDDWDSGFRNWSPDHSAKVASYFPDKRIACIGTKEMALQVEGTDDLRDHNLAEIMDIIANADVFVGPLSGPSHLASLCGTPQVTWVTKKEHEDRVKTKWNPLNAPTDVICAEDKIWKERIHWHPEVEDVVTRIRKALDG